MAIAWPEERVETLKRLHGKGLLQADIARRMGISPSSVKSKLDRLDLGRASPAEPRRIGA